MYDTYSNANVMKKLVPVALLILFAACGFAQSENIRLGFQLSPVISWMGTDDQTIRRTGSNVGLQAGAAGEYYFSENVAVTAGVGLAFNKGGSLRHETGGNFFPHSRLSDNLYNTGDKPLPDEVRIKYKLQYLEIPLGLKVRSNEKGYIRWYGELPMFTMGFRAQARADIEGDEINTTKENVSGDVGFFNFSIGGGGGIEYSINESISGVLGLYYTAGLSDITSNDGYKAVENPQNNPFDPDDDYITEPEDSKARLRSVTIRLALMF